MNLDQFDLIRSVQQSWQSMSCAGFIQSIGVLVDLFQFKKKMAEWGGEVHFHGRLKNHFCLSILTLSHFAVRLLRLLFLLSLTVLNERKKFILFSLREMLVFSYGVMDTYVADFPSVERLWRLKLCMKMMFSIEASVKIKYLYSQTSQPTFAQSQPLFPDPYIKLGIQMEYLRITTVCHK